MTDKPIAFTSTVSKVPPLGPQPIQEPPPLVPGPGHPDYDEVEHAAWLEWKQTRDAEPRAAARAYWDRLQGAPNAE